MADGVVSTKFVGNSNDAQRAIAELEKKYSDLNNKISEGASKSKQAAVAAKQAMKEHERDVQNDAKISRETYRRTVKELERAERDKIRAEKEAAAEHRRIARQDADESRRIYRQTVKILEQEDNKRIAAKKRQAAEIKKVNEANAKTTDQVQSWVGGIVSAGAAYGVVRGIVGDLISEQQKMIDQSDEVGRKMDMIGRKYQVQASLLTAPEGLKAQEDLERLAIKNAVTTESATGVATQMASSGFKGQKDQMEATDIVLQTAAATGNIDGDHAGLAKSMTQAASAFGLKRDPESMRRVGRMMAGSYKVGDFQADDMGMLAPNVQGLVSQGQTPEDILAMYNIMRAVTDPGKASTALKGFSEAHAAAVKLPGQKESRQEKLLKLLQVKDATTGKMRSLTSDEVDLQGEDFSKVQPLMQEGLSNLTKPQQMKWLQEFYGKEHATSVQGLYARGEQFAEFRDGQFNQKQFDADVKHAQSGRGAARTRIEEKIKREARLRATDETSLYDEYGFAERAAGKSELASTQSRRIANTLRVGSFGTLAPGAALTTGDNLTSTGGVLSMLFGGGATIATSLGNAIGGGGQTATYQEALRSTMQSLGGEMPVGISRQDQEYLVAVKKQNELIERQIKLQEEGNDLLRQRVVNQAPAPVKRPVAVNANE